MSYVNYLNKVFLLSLLTLISLPLISINFVYAADNEKNRGKTLYKKRYTSKSYILHEVPLSPDEKSRKKIKEFNGTPRQDLPFQEQVLLYRDFCSSLEKYFNKGSKLAEKALPDAQTRLGLVLANTSDSLPAKEAIDCLKESILLIAANAKKGNQKAIKNLPLAQNKLAVTLVNSIQGLPEDIPLLREALDLLAHSAHAGLLIAKDNIPIVQDRMEKILEKLPKGSAFTD
jgi:hypothetical protein